MRKIKTIIQPKTILPPLILIGGPLSNIPDQMALEKVRAFYLEQARICNRHGCYAYVSELAEKQFKMPTEFLDSSIRRVIGACSMVTTLNQFGSFGAGSEAETSRILGIPLVVFVHEKSHVNPMLKKPNLVKIIKFRDYDNALDQFEALIKDFEFGQIEIPGIPEE